MQGTQMQHNSSTLKPVGGWGGNDNQRSPRGHMAPEQSSAHREKG